MTVPHTVQVLAPAKINLALHVTGQRDDGYHLIDSLVGFTRLGDTLTVTAPGCGELSVSGPFGRDVPTDGSNLICKMAEHVWPEMRMSFHVHKELPVASGIGGGSADAAACYRAIAMLRQLSGEGDEPLLMTDDKIAALAGLGADIPMCVYSEAALVQGIGEDIRPVADLPALPILLVNPGIGVSTPAVFKALVNKSNPATAPLVDVLNGHAFLDWLDDQRNDLQGPACDLMPQIPKVLECLRSMTGCSLVRMSGSGATCFGLFHDCEVIKQAAAQIKEAYPSWWVRATVINGPSLAAPHRMRSTT